MSNFNDPTSPLPPPQVVGTSAAVPATSGKAIASMVLGIVSCLSFCLCYGIISIPCGILGIVFAKQAAADVAAGRAGHGGDGMAKAGKICGIIGLCLVVLYWLVVIGALAFIGLNGGFSSGGFNKP